MATPLTQSAEDEAEQAATEGRLQGEEARLDLAARGREQRLEPWGVARLARLDVRRGRRIGADEGLALAGRVSRAEDHGEREEGDDGGDDTQGAQVLTHG